MLSFKGQRNKAGIRAVSMAGKTRLSAIDQALAGQSDVTGQKNSHSACFQKPLPFE
jgi:hypothetical protein